MTENSFVKQVAQGNELGLGMEFWKKLEEGRRIYGSRRERIGSTAVFEDGDRFAGQAIVIGESACDGADVAQGRHNWQDWGRNSR